MILLIIKEATLRFFIRRMNQKWFMLMDKIHTDHLSSTSIPKKKSMSTIALKLKWPIRVCKAFHSEKGPSLRRRKLPSIIIIRCLGDNIKANKCKLGPPTILITKQGLQTSWCLKTLVANLKIYTSHKATRFHPRHHPISINSECRMKVPVNKCTKIISTSSKIIFSKTPTNNS